MGPVAGVKAFYVAEVADAAWVAVAVAAAALASVVVALAAAVFWTEVQSQLCCARGVLVLLYNAHQGVAEVQVTEIYAVKPLVYKLSADIPSAARKAEDLV